MDRTITVDYPASGGVFYCDICLASRLISPDAGSSDRIIFTSRNVGDYGLRKPRGNGYVQPLTNYQVAGGNRGLLF